MNSGSIKINEHTKIAVLIKANPLTIATLAAFNPHFKKLKNVILRKLLAPRVTIAEACVIGKCKVSDFLSEMKKIGFEIEESTLKSEIKIQNTALFSKSSEVLDFDVRPILAQEKDPLKLILQKIETLKENQLLRIINDFEPIPLINLLTKKGFQYQTERIDEKTVITSFAKIKDVQNEVFNQKKLVMESAHQDDFEQKLNSFAENKIHFIDVRDLEMPLPMTNILKALDNLQPDEALFVYHKKVPAFLLPELNDRSFQFLIQNTPDHKINMLIFKS